MWIDSHCHLDAPEFDADRSEVVARAQSAGIVHMVIPAVIPKHFERVVELAHTYNYSYALGIHPLWLDACTNKDCTDQQALAQLEQALKYHQHDPRLVAIGEIGLDYFGKTPSPERQWTFYTQQLKLAHTFDLPVILHVRRSADMLLKGLRQYPVSCGIAHAFNGSLQQAQAFTRLGFKLGFGGTSTFEAARNIRHLAQTLPIENLVLETDAPDIPPQWLYKTAQQRQAGAPQARNEPAQLARIASTIAHLRGIDEQAFSQQLWLNTQAALPKLKLFEIPCPTSNHEKPTT